MSNRTVPAAAEGLPHDRNGKLETLIDAARMSAKLQNWLINEMLGGALRDDRTIHVAEEDRELLVFAAGQSHAAAEEANAAYLEWRYGR